MSMAMMVVAPAMLGTLDHVEAHAAAADHGHGVAGGDVGGVERRAHAGEHAAADERGHVERHVVGDLHRWRSPGTMA
jgi:hypothetical protein